MPEQVVVPRFRECRSYFLIRLNLRCSHAGQNLVYQWLAKPGSPRDLSLGKIVFLRKF